MNRDLDWMADAACAGQNTDLYVPPVEGRIPPIVKKTCRNCPVLNDCLNYAIHNKVEGYWGATTTDQRKQFRKQLGITAEPVIYVNRCGTPAGYQRHQRAKEAPCEACRRAEAVRTWKKRRTDTRKPTTWPPECGTTDGAIWHQSLGEPVCPACVEAERQAELLRQKRRQRAAKKKEAS